MKMTKQFYFILILSVCSVIFFSESLFPQTFTLRTETFGQFIFGIDITSCFGDIDGDGKLDMLVGNQAGEIDRLEQSSVNSLSFICDDNFQSIIVQYGYSAPLLCDLDGDGLLDLLVGSASAYDFYYYEQDSPNSTSFILKTDNLLQHATGSGILRPAIADIDGNGLLDLLIGENNGHVYRYEQTAVHSTSFTFITSDFNSINVGTLSSCAIADIDGDGKLDLLVGEINGNIHHYEQASVNSTTFNLVTDRFNSIDVGDDSSPRFADLNGDGKLDLIVGRYTDKLFHYYSDLVTINLSCVTTSNASSIEIQSAILGGNVSNDNGKPIFCRGVCYSSSNANPTLAADSKQIIGSGKGSFSVNVTGLSMFTTYYYRAYAESELGTFYGEVKSFTTPAGVPVLTTNDITNVHSTTGTSGGNITDGGGSSVTARGVCWSTSENPTTSNAHTADGSGTGTFTSSITGLTPLTTYYVRAYATNTSGTGYGEQKSFIAHQFDLVTSTFCSIDVGSNAVPAICDIDGDGLQDLIIGNTDGILSHYEQTAVHSTTFTLITNNFNSIDIGYESEPVFTDLNGDGKLDLLIGEHNAKIHYYRQIALYSNDFTLVTNDLLAHNFTYINAIPEVSDFDNDGLLDLFIGNLDGNVYYYEQSSANSTTFNLVSSHFTHTSNDWSSPRMTDLENDGLYDLLVGVSGGGIIRYEQESVNSQNFVLSSSNLDNIDIGSDASPVITDLDGDGHIDMLVGKEDGKISYYISASTAINTNCVTTSDASSITSTTVSVGGTITDNNSTVITRRGVCYSVSNSTPALTDSQTTIGSGNGSFSASISNLVQNTQYYYRAFSSSVLGVYYGDVKNFRTAKLPVVTTNDVSEIDNESAVSGGNITDEGSSGITSRGICWSVSENPTISNSHTSDGSGSGSFVSSFQGLTEGTNYYIKAYASNSFGTSYGEQKSFTTEARPSITTNDISAVSPNSAISGGNITSNNGKEVTSRGICWSTNTDPTTADNFTEDGTGSGVFQGGITGLTKNTKYYVRAYATNVYGTSYGEQKEFFTPNQLYNMLDFDGADDYMSAPLTLPNQGTIEFWFNAEYNTGNFWSESLTQRWYCNLSNGSLYTYIGSAGNALRVEGISTDTWHHCAVTWLNTFGIVTVRLFLDGNLKVQTANSWVAQTNPLFIGVRYDESNDFYQYLNGKLDEFRIWNTVRSETEIRNNMHSFIDPSTSGLILYYNFDQSSGSIVTDRTSSGYDGNLVNTTNSIWTTSTAPIGVYGNPDRVTTQTSAGQLGKSISATISNGDDTNYLGLYTYGDGDGSINEETFPSGVTKRTNFIWGIKEFGNCTSDLVLDYSGIEGTTTNESELKLIKRSDATSIWTDITSAASQNTSNHTLTLSGITDYSEFSIGDGGVNPLPVELSSFSANTIDGKVILNWKTATEVNNYGFEVERTFSCPQSSAGSQSQNTWEKIGFVNGSGNSNSPKEYSFFDKIVLSGKYLYRLKQIDNDGGFNYSQEVEVKVEDIPTEFALSQNYPNPFNPNTVINYQLPVNGFVTLKVYDVLGNEVVTLVNEVKEPGSYEVEFQSTVGNRQSSGGVSAQGGYASGVYFYQLKAGAFVQTKKMLYLR
ncbi:MAG: FG-GAP-like repeat-containing protein [Ignavibacteriaceae bacterium]|jgi:uncharacterized protein (DUF2141 family)